MGKGFIGSHDAFPCVAASLDLGALTVLRLVWLHPSLTSPCLQLRVQTQRNKSSSCQEP